MSTIVSPKAWNIISRTSFSGSRAMKSETDFGTLTRKFHHGSKKVAKSFS
jgi:hypothetical protein